MDPECVRATIGSMERNRVGDHLASILGSGRFLLDSAVSWCPTGKLPSQFDNEDAFANAGLHFANFVYIACRKASKSASSGFLSGVLR